MLKLTAYKQTDRQKNKQTNKQTDRAKQYAPDHSIRENKNQVDVTMVCSKDNHILSYCV